MKLFFTCIIVSLFVSFTSGQVTYTWNRNGTPASWLVATNWTPTWTTRTVSDVMVFDGAVTPVAIVNVLPAGEQRGKLWIKNNADVTLGTSSNAVLNFGHVAVTAPHIQVDAGCTLKCNSVGNTVNLEIGSGFNAQIAGNIIFSGDAHTFTGLAPSSIIFQNGSSFTASTNFTGNAFGSSTSNINSVVFENGSKYVHEAGGNPFALTAPASVVIFQKGSLYSLKTSGFISGSGRSYANLDVNNSGTATVTGSLPMRVDTLTLSNGTAVNINTTGGLIVSGDLKATTGSINITPSSGASTILFDGNIQQNTSGTIKFSDDNFTGTVVLGVGNLSNVNLLTDLLLLDSVNVHGKLYMNNQTVNSNAFSMYPDNTFPSTTATATGGSNILTAVVNTQNFRIGGQVNIAGFPANTYVMKIVTNTIHLSNFSTFTGNVSVRPIYNVATLGIGSANGISAWPALTGNVLSGIRRFQSRGNYEYTGSLAQVTGNGLPASVKNLILNKSAAANVNLSASVTIDDTLALQKGFLGSATNFEPTLRDTTAVSSPLNIYGYINEGHQESFIKGPLNIAASSAVSKIAPIGKNAHFAPVRLNKTNAGDVTYRLEYFDQAYSDVATDTLPLDHVSKLEHWLISANTTGSVVNANVTLSWSPYSQIGDGNSANDAQALSDLVVAHYINDGAGNKWRIDGADNNSMPKNPSANVFYGMVTTNLPTGMFSPFTLGTKSQFNILPLKLISFNASHANDNIRLAWTVQNEENTKEYEVQRSGDGIFFNTVATFSSTRLPFATYQFEDVSPNTGLNYYRLKIISKRNAITYSLILKLGGKDNSGISFYPNPALEKIILNLPFSRSNSIVEIVNTSGKRIQKLIFGSGATEINIADLSPGNYFMKITTGSKTITRKFIKR